ncbi:hypothetical protein CDO73_17595 [Saccharibacillus sp. O23]|uniref:hypothetical protein n=1 Tax=Saccharibacillus sp. O23 TaxID=2009338 RepID=UPI000B4E5900|nr:hypothetical protein [Saccharibacillus sp. O23]OWR28712.1 hypothetical protein CDO73_17595 [Saccharibacillus sp. O23]
MPTKKPFVRVSAAALAVAVSLGGFGFQPSAMQAAENVSTSQTAISPSFLNDPLRLDLARINGKKDRVFGITGSYSYNPDSYEYYDLIAVEKQAYEVALDPNSSAALLAQVAQNYDQRLNAYMDRYLDKQNVTKSLATLYYILYYNVAKENIDNLDPQDRALFQLVLDTQAYWDNTNATTNQEHVDGYKIYLNAVVKLDDTETYKAQSYQDTVNRYRTGIQSQLANTPGGTDGHETSLALFERSASLLEQSASAGYNYNMVEMIKDDLERRYYELLDELKKDTTPAPTPVQNDKVQLQNRIDYAWTLMELPAGIRSGQTPQSAFGDLRRAIRKAESVYEKGSTAAEFKAAREELDGSIQVFVSRKKP